MIRSLGPGDAAAVARLSAQLGYPDVTEAVARERLAALDPAADAALGYETADGSLVGFIHARRTASLVDAPFALIAAQLALVHRLRCRRALLDRGPPPRPAPDPARGADLAPQRITATPGDAVDLGELRLEAR